jgi:hypothetical protein
MPKSAVHGYTIDYKKELLFTFGDYIEVYEGMENTSRSRSSACITLYRSATHLVPGYFGK